MDTLVCFMQFMARTSGFQHLKHLLASVKFLHNALGHVFPEDNFQLDMSMQGLKRRLAKVPFQVLPITPGILRKLFPFVNLSCPEDQAIWTSFLTAFYGLLRKANVVPRTSEYEPNKVLVGRNVLVDSEKNMVYLYIGFGKTNQFGRKDIVIPIPGNNDPALDPVRHFEAMFNNYKPKSDEPAFSYRSGKFVTYTKFTSRLNFITV